MEIKPEVGILSPGDMGHSVGQVLIENGIQVFTCLHRANRGTSDV